MTTFTLSYGDPVTGLWCPACALPSAVSVVISVLTERGVGSPVTVTGCPDCGNSQAKHTA